MLVSLRIRDYALIDDLTIEFEPGLNILTGETGAGKSIVIGALSLLLGGRSDSNAIRTGAESATVEARFDSGCAALAALGIDPSPDVQPDGTPELIVRRRVDKSGRNAAWACDTAVTIAGLARAGDRLVDLHGQHDHQLLLRPEVHLEVLDEYAGLGDDRRAFGELFNRVRALEGELRELDEAITREQTQQELTEYQYRELTDAHVAAGELEGLHLERKLLQTAERRYALARRLEELLSDAEPSAGSLISAALKTIGELAALDPTLTGRHQTIVEAQAALDDLWREAVRYREAVDFSPERLERINSRLFLIEKLERKYRLKADELCELEARLRARLGGVETEAGRRRELAAELVELRGRLQKLAGTLTRRRTRAAGKIEPLLKKELATLGLQAAEITVQLNPGPLTPAGADTVELQFSANPGETSRPLRRVASGGELSRVMLALKGVLAEADPIPTLIFDEIDSGIGGRIAEAVGRRLRQLARTRQLIVITHLPQLAKYADAHFSVTKAVRDGRTITTVARLDSDQQVNELARMAAGETITPAALAHARQLLAQGRERT